MRQFRFSLEAVATMRRHAEQVAVEVFSHAGREHRVAVGRFDAVQAELDQAMHTRRAQVARPASEWARAQAWQSVLEGRAKEAAANVASAHRVLSDANRGLMLARQRREAVEKLRTSRRSRYDQEVRRAEQKVLDEVTRRETLAQGMLNVGVEGSVGLGP